MRGNTSIRGPLEPGVQRRCLAAMAAAFIELLRGDKARREIAYAQLEALSGSDGAMSGSDAAAISAASVSVTGVDVAELSDEARIAVACVAPMLEHVLGGRRGGVPEGDARAARGAPR